MRYGWLLPLLDLVQQLPRMVLRMTTNLLDQEDCYGIPLLKKIVHVIFAVTDNRENLLTAKISWYTVYKCRHCLRYSTKSAEVMAVNFCISCDSWYSILSVLWAQYGKPVSTIGNFYEQCFPTHSISRGHFQPLQLLNILSLLFPWAVGLRLLPKVISAI